MKKMIKRREAYFPVFEMLLAINKHKSDYEFPVRIKAASDIAVVLELIDIGYLDRDAFIINKNRRYITSLYYNGEYPMTGEGIVEYRRHLHARRGFYIKLLIALSFAVLLAALSMLVF